MIGRPEAVVVLGVLLLTAGCLGGGGQGGQGDRPVEPTQGPQGAPTVVEQAHGLLSYQAGVGAAAADTWILVLGEFELPFTVPEDATRLVVDGSLTDPGANATGPGAGLPGLALYDGQDRQAASGPEGLGTYSFEVDDPSPGGWSVKITPGGAGVDRTIWVEVTVWGLPATSPAGQATGQPR